MDGNGSPAAAWRLRAAGVASLPAAGAFRAVAAVAAALTLTGAAAPANAAPPRAVAVSGHWTIQRVPSPATRLGQLNGVSCTSAGACAAVGSYQNSSGTQVALAEARNGTAWSVQTVPSPPGATASVLSGVSCTSPNACTAVGYYDQGPGAPVALAEAWNGTAWSVQTVPSPPGATQSSLSGVSCTSPSACTAVGDTNKGALAEAWDGTAWSAQPTPAVPGGGSLSGVWCTTARACTAVGHYLPGTRERATLAEAWDGTAWSVQPTPIPAGATESSLSGVACTARDACTAVGQYDNRHGRSFTLAQAWNGTSWSVQPAPSLRGRASLSGVSCTSPAACTAVGNDYTSSTPVTLAEAWNGTAWSVQPAPSPASPAGSSLSGVSCASASACTAVGSDYTALAEAWNGTSWSVGHARTPASAARSFLSGVSCTSASACTAVGAYYTRSSAGVLSPLAERWNGSAWLIQRTPVPPGAIGGSLSGVSCTSARACTAVGNWFGSSGSPVTLAEAWNGSAWSVQPTPNPSGSVFGASLSGVSCTSPAACAAVGSYQTGQLSTATLAEAWNGTSWSIQRTPQLPTGVRHVLNAISCTSAGACTAVGAVGYDTLAEAWNGTTWSKQPTPQFSGPPHVAHVLTGVSCTSASACIAVGSGYDTMLAEAWNGTAWSLQPVPSREISFFNDLGGVACPSAGACTAVWSSGFRTVAGVWNGTKWSLQRTRNPAGSVLGYHVLSSVSCTSASACTAVGSYPSAVGGSVLAEAKP